MYIASRLLRLTPAQPRERARESGASYLYTYVCLVYTVYMFIPILLHICISSRLPRVNPAQPRERARESGASYLYTYVRLVYTVYMYIPIIGLTLIVFFYFFLSRCLWKHFGSACPIYICVYVFF